jgi:hypothetical protein
VIATNTRAVIGSASASENSTLADDAVVITDDPGIIASVRKSHFPDIFALGDVAATPNAKTGAATRKQAPVFVDNLLASWAGMALTGRCNGYGSCPLTTSRKTMLLAEFDYSVKHTPSFPIIDTTKSRRDVVPQTLRSSVRVLEHDAQGPRLTAL